jgi:hypothetical protein
VKGVRSALVFSLVGLMAGGASREAKPSLLRTGAAYVCGPGPTFLVSARADGRYAFGKAVFDSAHLVGALHNVLPPLPNKTIMVSADSARSGELPWIVAAIRREGGAAYAVDSTCLNEHHAPGSFFVPAGDVTRPPPPAFPGSAVVPPGAPDGVSEQLLRAFGVFPGRSGPYGWVVRNVITLDFKEGARPRQRQAAVDAVRGRVIGGLRERYGEGDYFVWVADTGFAALWKVMDRLKKLPQVDYAGPMFIDTTPGQVVALRGFGIGR